MPITAPVSALLTRTQRLNAFALAAAPICRAHDYPLEVVIGIWAVESSWGTKTSGPNNYFGITWPSVTAPEGTRPWLRRTREVLTSRQLQRHLDNNILVLHEPMVFTNTPRSWDVSRNFCGYPNLETAIQHLCRLLTSGPYRPAYHSYLKDRKIWRLVENTGRVYATDPNWGRLVYQISQQKNVAAALKAAQKETAK